MQSKANYSNQLGIAFKIIQIKWTSIDEVQLLAKILIKLNKFYVIPNSFRVFPFQKVSKNCSKIVLYAGLSLANVLFMINWFSRSSNISTLFPTNAFVRMLRELAQFTARNSYRTATEWKSKKHKNQIRTNRIEKMDDWTKKNTTNSIVDLVSLSAAPFRTILFSLGLHVDSFLLLLLVRSLLECVFFVFAPCVLRIYYSLFACMRACVRVCIFLFHLLFHTSSLLSALVCCALSCLTDTRHISWALDLMQACIPFLSRLGRSVCLQFVVWPVLFFSSMKRVATQQEK